jgi:saccharopepsin
LYTANVSIGSPPQPFTVAVDISEGFPLLVPSANCDPRWCGEEEEEPIFRKRKYNSSISSSYHPVGAYSSVMWGNVEWRGFLSEDDVRIGDVSVSRQVFEEWTEGSASGFFGWTLGYEGVLGLGPPWQQMSSVPSFFTTLVAYGQLDEPIFSLKLPNSESQQGELLFGGRNPELYEGELATVPLAEKVHLWDRGLWTLPLDNITLDTPVPLELSFAPDAYATLDSGWPFILLPHDYYVLVKAAIGAEVPPGDVFLHIPCERRQELPSMTFTLAGKNLTISPFDYTLEVNPRWNRDAKPFCAPAFASARDWGAMDENVVYLSSPFLRGLYTVFDIEKKEVGCKFLLQLFNPWSWGQY